jgi:hypothetical protein
LAIGKAYAQGKANGYRADLIDNAAKFGFTTEQIEGMKQPVLIRVLAKDVDMQQAAIASNEGGGARMSALEQAKVDGIRMGDLGDFHPDDSGNLNNAANRDFVKRFLANMPVNQRPAFQSKDGLLSQEGMTRLRNAVLYRAYGDSDVLSRMAENTDAGQKNLLNALTKMAPVVAQAKAEAQAGNLYDLDISADIVAAAHTLAQIKAEGTFSGADDWLRQQNLFGDTLNEESKQLLIYFDHNLRSAKGLTEFLSDYYQAVQVLGSPKQQGMFGNATPTKHQLLRNASDRKTQTAQESDLFGFGKSHSFADRQVPKRPDDGKGSANGNGKGQGKAQGPNVRVLFFPEPLRQALLKSEVKGHLRTLPDGRTVFVREHSDKRTKRTGNGDEPAESHGERLAPNGKPSNLNPTQHAQVRTPEFKAWFGDWETLAKLKWLDSGEPIATMQGGEVPRFGKIKELASWVSDYFAAKTDNAVERDDLGRIGLDKVSVHDSLGHGYGATKIQAFYLVPEALQKGTLLGQLPRVQHKPEAFLIAAPVSIGGKAYRLLMEVRRDANMQRLYLHEAVLREGNPASAFNSSAASPSKEAEPQGARRGAIYEFIHSLRQTQALKAVDENGEPLPSAIDGFNASRAVAKAQTARPMVLFLRRAA